MPVEETTESIARKALRRYEKACIFEEGTNSMIECICKGVN
jgi:hypothetical protein